MRNRTIVRRPYLFAAAVVSLLTLGSAMAAESGSPRIEDFDVNLPAGEITSSRADYSRSIATQAYIWGIPAFLNFRQATEFKQGRQHLSPDEEPFGGWVFDPRPIDTRNEQRPSQCRYLIWRVLCAARPSGSRRA